MRVLVLGASGFVPASLCGYLSESGFEVYTASRSLESATNIKRNFASTHENEFDPNKFLEFLQSFEIEAIINSANVFLARANPQALRSMYWTNFTLPSLALSCASMAKIKLFINLCSNWQLDESKSISSAPYVASKNAFVEFSKSFESSLDIRHLYLGEIFGPFDSRPKLINQAVSASLRRQTFIVKSPETRLHLVYVFRLASHIAELLGGLRATSQSYSYVNYPNISVSRLMGFIDSIATNGLSWKALNLSRESVSMHEVNAGEASLGELMADLSTVYKEFSQTMPGGGDYDLRDY